MKKSDDSTKGKQNSVVTDEIKSNTSFINLTWEDLDDWVGRSIVSRGKSYQSRVQDLCVTADGALVASVRGTQWYSTRTGFKANDELFSECTCPYGAGCEHAVAMIFVYLDAYKKKKNILLAEPDDERLQDFLGENDEEQLIKNDSVRMHLEGLSKSALIDLVMKDESILPDLNEKLADRAHLKNGDTDKLMKAIRKEIKKISFSRGLLCF